MNVRTAAIGAAGAGAMSAQLLLAREMMVAGRGDELSIAMVFFAWMLWVGAGSAAGGLAAKRARPSPGAVAAMLTVCGLLIPLSVVWARYQGQVFGFHHGELLPLGTTLAASLSALGPAGFCTGLLFPFLCRLTELESGRGRAGAVYSLDTLGSVGGGVVFSLVLVEVLPPVACALLFGAMAAGAGAMLAAGRAQLLMTVVCAAVVVSSPFWLGPVEKASREAAWGRPIEFSVESGYGNITVLKDNEQYSIFASGRYTGAIPDRVFGQYTAHMPLLAHPAPKRVMMVGASATAVAESLEHGLEKLDVVELDPRMLAVKKELCPEDLKWIYADPRVRFIERDPRRYMAQTENVYDVIVIDAGAPHTLQQNRYFTAGFLALLRRRLAPGGIAATSVPFTENYMGSDESALLGSIIATYGELDAAMPALLPGRRTFLVWSPDRRFELPAEEAAARFRTRVIVSEHFNADSAAYYFDSSRIGFALSQFSDDIMEYTMSGDKMGAALSWLAAREGATPNTDNHPSGVYLNSLFVTAHFRSPAYKIVDFAGRLLKGNIAFYLAGLGIALFGVSLAGEAGRRLSITLGVLLAGFTGIVVELLMVFRFQAEFGVVYQYLGLLTAAFMGGTAAGGAAGAGFVRRGAGGSWMLPVTAAGMAAAVAAGYVYTVAVDVSGYSGAAIIAAIVFAAGAATGFIYPWAVAVWQVREDATEAGAAGFLYAADLAGACAGALLVGAILFPLLGAAGSFGLLFPACFAVFGGFLGAAAGRLRGQ